MYSSMFVRQHDLDAKALVERTKAQKGVNGLKEVLESNLEVRVDVCQSLWLLLLMLFYVCVSILFSFDSLSYILTVHFYLFLLFVLCVCIYNCMYIMFLG